MATAAEIQAVIDGLEDAKTQLALGKSVQMTGYDGKTVTYRNTDMGAISGRIAELKYQLAQLTGQGRSRAFPVQFS